MTLPTEALAKTSWNALKVRLFHHVEAVCQDAGKRIESSLQLYKDDDDRKVRNAPLSFSARQYIYPQWPPMTTSAAEGLATESYNSLVFRKTGNFKVIEV